MRTLSVRQLLCRKQYSIRFHSHLSPIGSCANKGEAKCSWEGGERAEAFPSRKKREEGYYAVWQGFSNRAEMYSSLRFQIVKRDSQIKIENTKAQWRNITLELPSWIRESLKKNWIKDNLHTHTRTHAHAHRNRTSIILFSIKYFIRELILYY